MSGIRAIVQDQGGLTRNARAGDGMNMYPNVTIVTTDAADTFTVAKMATGVYVYSSLSAGRVLTTDTAANIVAAYPNLDVGDSVSVIVATVAAFALTVAAGTGVTLKGKTTIPASTTGWLIFVKTSATTCDCVVL